MTDSDELREQANARLGTWLRQKYRLDRVLGLGGMAVVYASKHRNNAELAIKMLHPELSRRSDVRERFLREGYIANSVQHPGAVLVSDDDVAEDGAAFLVMELLRGQSVETICDAHGKILSAAAALAIGIELLDVLAAAHSHAIVHRDIKPSNVFITLDGTLKVLDFGIARIRDAAGSKETGAGMVLGTPAFMAHEQALGQTNDVGPQTDLWAVGATLFTLISGQLVHPGETSQHVYVKAATTQPRLVGTVVPSLPRDVAYCIDHALAFQRRDRWESATAMRDALIAASAANYGAVDRRRLLASLVQSASPQRHPAGEGVGLRAEPAAPHSTAAGSNAPSIEFGGEARRAPRGATAFDSSPRFGQRAGGTTVQPVATVGRRGGSVRNKRRDLALGAIGGLGAILAFGSAAAVLMRTPPQLPPPEAAASATIPLVNAAGTPAATSGDRRVDPSPMPGPEHPRPTAEPPATTAGAAPPAPRGTAPALRAAATGRAGHPVVDGAATLSERAAVPPPPDPCDPPYTLTPGGDRVPKTECM